MKQFVNKWEITSEIFVTSILCELFIGNAEQEVILCLCHFCPSMLLASVHL